MSESFDPLNYTPDLTRKMKSYVTALAITLVALGVHQMTQATEVDTQREMPPDVLDYIGQKIPDGEGLYAFRRLNKQSHRFAHDQFPGGNTCKPFKSLIVNIKRDSRDKSVTFSETAMTDLLKSLLPKSTGQSKVGSKRYRDDYEALKPGQHIYEGLREFYRCVNKLAESYTIEGFNVEDMKEFRKLSESEGIPIHEPLNSNGWYKFGAPKKMNPLKTLKMIVEEETSATDTTIPLLLLNAFYSEDGYDLWDSLFVKVLPSRVRGNTSWWEPLLYVKDENRFTGLSEKSLSAFVAAKEDDRAKYARHPWCQSQWTFPHLSILADNDIVLSAILKEEDQATICQCQRDFLSDPERKISTHVSKWFADQGCDE